MYKTYQQARKTSIRGSAPPTRKSVNFLCVGWLQFNIVNWWLFRFCCQLRFVAMNRKAQLNWVFVNKQDRKEYLCLFEPESLSQFGSFTLTTISPASCFSKCTSNDFEHMNPLLHIWHVRPLIWIDSKRINECHPSIQYQRCAYVYSDVLF